MMIPRGWMKHPEISAELHPVIVPDPMHFGAREDPPAAPPGWLWRYFVPCDGYRLERDGHAAPSGYEPDDFMGGDTAAIWDAVKQAARRIARGDDGARWASC